VEINIRLPGTELLGGSTLEAPGVARLVEPDREQQGFQGVQLTRGSRRVNANFSRRATPIRPLACPRSLSKVPHPHGLSYQVNAI